MQAVVATLLKTILVIVAIPGAAIASLIFRSRVRLSAADVASHLHNFIDGNGGNYDWDDFTSVPIANQQLDDIRCRAAAVDLPVTKEGYMTLRVLLAEAERLASSRP